MSARCTVAGADVTRTASRRKAAFLALRSTRWTIGARRLRQRAGQHHAGKAAAAAEVDPDLRRRGEVQELQRIGDVAGPEMWKRRGRDEIGLGLPLQEQIDVAIEPRLCFT